MYTSAEQKETIRALAALPKSAESRKLLWLFAHGDRSAEFFAQVKIFIAKSAPETGKPNPGVEDVPPLWPGQGAGSRPAGGLADLSAAVGPTE
jgi:hypothetical protein